MAARQATGLRRGDRVRLTEVPGTGYEEYGLSAGQLGTVDLVDSLGTIHVNWDGGLRVGITAQYHDLVRRA